MTIRVRSGVVILLALSSTWGLGGCSTRESSAASNKEVDSARPADHAEAKKAERHREHSHGRDGDEKEKHHQDAKPGGVKVGDKVPDFSVRTLDDKVVKLSELQKGQGRTKNGVVVLSFWCSTCHSCRHVEKQLAKLHKDYEGRAAVMALDANANETAQEVAAFLEKQALALPVLLDAGGHSADLFAAQRTTTTVIIDSEGVLRYCGQFAQSGGASAEDALRAVLAGQEVAVKTTSQRG
jgi:peroxiredoxin